jgi:hypothetical protein
MRSVYVLQRTLDLRGSFGATLHGMRRDVGDFRNRGQPGYNEGESVKFLILMVRPE